MASIQAWVLPGDHIDVRSAETAAGWYAMFTVDGVDVWVSDPAAANRDAGIVATTGLLIDALDKLRDAAKVRQHAAMVYAGEIAGIDEESPAERHEVVAERTRVTA